MVQSTRIGTVAALVAFCLLGMVAQATDYFVYDDWGGTWADANKTGSDNGMCWAAAASNVLQWTGWGNASQETFGSENDIFNYFKSHWTNMGGQAQYGYEWWFQGGNNSYPPPGRDPAEWSHVTSPGGGFWSPPYQFNDFFLVQQDPAQTVSFVGQSLRDGYGTTLGIIHSNWPLSDVGHALTCWGLRYDDTGNPLGIHVTDSDDATAISYYPISQQSDGKWYLQDYSGSNGWYIGFADALRIQQASVENRTFTVTDGYRSFAELTAGYGDWNSGSIIQTGGTISVRGNLNFGYQAHAAGDYDLSATSLLMVDKDEFIGYSGSGEFEQSGGTHRVGQTLYLARTSGSLGDYYLSATSILSVGHDEFIGHSGHSMFDQSGGHHTVAGTLYLGRNAGAIAHYLLSADSTLSVGLDEFIGHSGVGTFSQGGGEHVVSHTLYLGRDSGGRGYYNLHSGVLTTTDEIIGHTGIGSFTQSGGTHNVLGNLTLAVASGSVGTFNLMGGTATVDKSIIGGLGNSTFRVKGGNATVWGSVENIGTVDVQGGAVSIKGNYMQNAGGHLLLWLADDGQPGRLSVEGTAFLDGSLEIGLADGYLPSPGDTIDVLSFGSRSGWFSSIIGQVYHVDSSLGYFFLPAYYSNNLTLVAASTLLGDANLDGVVDITDLSRLLANYDTWGMRWGQGDFDGNGVVDISDLSKVVVNYDQITGASARRAPYQSRPAYPLVSVSQS